MSRTDLLALDTEALVVLANRGIVKRAQAEVESGALTFEISEEEGALKVRWSDDVECVVPAGKSLADGRCTCPATSLCRHLVRSVLAYQLHAGGHTAPAPEVTVGTGDEEPSTTQAPAPAPAPASGEPWDPGSITDELLAGFYRPQQFARIQAEFEKGLTVELVRAAKPSAYLHDLSLNVRFLAPGRPEYTHCDCAEPSRPCSHVPLAVWAFRKLPEEQSGGLLTTRPEALPVPEPPLAELEQALCEYAVPGLQGAPRTMVERLRRIEKRFREVGLVWPAEGLADLLRQQEAYWEHDARFSPREVAELVAELCIRTDAIRSDTGAVPQLFIRGSGSDRLTDVGRSQMVALGCGARVRRGGVELSVYLHDDRSGAVVALAKDFADPDPESGDSPRAFHQLARSQVMTGVSMVQLGAGRLQIEGGRRTPSARFLPGRAKATLNPHAFQWEKQVRPPVLAEDFAELTARLAAQPPAFLRPRRVGANLHVCPVASVEGAAYSERDQTLYAGLADAAGNTALLAHPFSGRAAGGFEALARRIGAAGSALRLVAAEATLTGHGLVLRPLGLVFEEDGRRTMLQPWIDPPEADQPAPRDRGEGDTPLESSPIAHFAADLLEAVGETWLLGLQRADAHTARLWRGLHDRGAALGFNRLLTPIDRLAGALESRSQTLRWDPAPAAPLLLETAAAALLTAHAAGAT